MKAVTSTSIDAPSDVRALSAIYRVMEQFGLRNILAAPFWLAQLATGAKSFKDNPIIGSKRLNRWGLHAARVRVAHRLAQWRRNGLASRIDPVQRAQFEENGFIIVENFLPEAEFAALRKAVLVHEAPAREMVQGDTITRRIAMDATYLADLPAARKLLQSPLWRGLTRFVASHDSEPLHYVQTILTHQVDALPDPQTNLHADTFHPTMKAWYFLNDVKEDEGPFMYVPGSHRLTPERLAWEKAKSISAPEGVDHLSARGSMRIAADELPALGLPPPRAFGVRANTLVVADTCGFHARGPSVRPTRRVEIWAYARRNPFTPWSGFDLLSLPGIAERRIPWMWAFRDRFRRRIGQPWQAVGVKPPLGD